MKFLNYIKLFKIQGTGCTFYWIRFINYIKLFKIRGTGCHDINVTFLSSPKDGLLKCVKCEFRHVSSFSGI